MIIAVTGTPGSGKSFRMVCAIAEQLDAGGYVCTNIALKPDWAERLSRRSLLHKFARSEKRERSYRDRLYYSEDVDELLRVQLPVPRRRQRWEGRGSWVLDEAHENLNSRTWADESRLRVVQWLSRSRHRGWDVMLGTQHFDSLDKQLRDRVEFEEHVRNLKRAQIGGIGIVPFNLFLAIRVWRGGPTAKRHVAKRSLYLLDDRRNLYDTHGLRDLTAFELLDEDALFFPTDPRGLPASGRREAAGSPAPACRPDVNGHSDPDRRTAPLLTTPLAQSADERTPRRGHRTE